MKKHLSFYSLFFLLPLLVQGQFTRFEQVYDYGFGENAFDVQQTRDNGYVLTGSQGLSIGYSRIFVTKTDSLGEEEWHRFYGYPFDNEAYSIRQTQDDGYIVAGSTSGDQISATYSDIYVLRLNAEGDTLWTKTYGGAAADGAWDLELTPDNGFIICGWTKPVDTTIINGALLKIDSVGNLEWERAYEMDYNGQFRGVEVLSNGGFIVAGRLSVGLDGNQTWLVRTDDMGDTLWTNIHGGEEADFAEDVKPLKDGGFIAVGFTASYSASYFYDIFLLRIDSQGDTLWTKVISNGLSECTGRAITVLEDNSFTIVATDYNSLESYNTILIHTDEDGKIVWSQEFESEKSEYTYSLILTKDKGYAFVGGSSNNATTQSAFLKKTDEQGRIITALKPPILESRIFNIYPNPSTGLFKIELEGGISEKIHLMVYDQLGRIIYEDQLNTTFENYQFDLSEFTSGMYYLQLRNAKGLGITQKLILTGKE